jgi:hypothetical protein
MPLGRIGFYKNKNRHGTHAVPAPSTISISLSLSGGSNVSGADGVTSRTQIYDPDILTISLQSDVFKETVAAYEMQGNVSNTDFTNGVTTTGTIPLDATGNGNLVVHVDSANITNGDRDFNVHITMDTVDIVTSNNIYVYAVTSPNISVGNANVVTVNTQNGVSDRSIKGKYFTVTEAGQFSNIVVNDWNDGNTTKYEEAFGINGNNWQSGSNADISMYANGTFQVLLVGAGGNGLAEPPYWDFNSASNVNVIGGGSAGAGGDVVTLQRSLKDMYAFNTSIANTYPLFVGANTEPTAGNPTFPQTTLFFDIAGQSIEAKQGGNAEEEQSFPARLHGGGNANIFYTGNVLPIDNANMLTTFGGGDTQFEVAGVGGKSHNKFSGGGGAGASENGVDAGTYSFGAVIDALPPGKGGNGYVINNTIISDRNPTLDFNRANGNITVAGGGAGIGANTANGQVFTETGGLGGGGDSHSPGDPNTGGGAGGSNVLYQLPLSNLTPGTDYKLGGSGVAYVRYAYDDPFRYISLTDHS